MENSLQGARLWACPLSRMWLTVLRAPIFILHTVRDILDTNGFRGLWRGTGASLARYVNHRSSFRGKAEEYSNIPGVALYMTSLTQLRTFMATSPHFKMARVATVDDRGSYTVLPKLSSTGNLVAGATSRVAVGFLMNPFSVLKARYEVCFYSVSCSVNPG